MVVGVGGERESEKGSLDPYILQVFIESLGIQRPGLGGGFTR